MAPEWLDIFLRYDQEEIFIIYIIYINIDDVFSSDQNWYMGRPEHASEQDM